MATPDQHGCDPHIIDIRRDEIKFSILDEMKQLLRPENGTPKRLPTLLLYDERGLKLFENITYLDEYYLTDTEIQLLKHHADSIAERIPAGSQIIELGSGNLRKVAILLEAFERAEKQVDYYALDLSFPELKRTLAKVPKCFRHVRCYGLHGTYDDGLAWLKDPINRHQPKTVMTLGSSIGNFTRVDAAAFLSRFAEALGPEDNLVVAVDGCQDPEKVYQAYNDEKGITHDFVLNGLANANKMSGSEIFNVSDWRVIGEYDIAAGGHHAFVVPRKHANVNGVDIQAGEKVKIEESYKYSPSQEVKLFQDAGLSVAAQYADSSGTYRLSILKHAPFSFALTPGKYAAQPCPSIEEWEELWKAWDLVTRWMIPPEDLLSKPIQLRNCCLFYLGHIPTFLDIHVARGTDGNLSEPTSYRKIFERGIDPDVENPEKCHKHSEIPDEWPPLEKIVDYQQRIRTRARDLYKNGLSTIDARLARSLWIGFEHECMHLETLLYMVLQAERINPPLSVRPDFVTLAEEANRLEVPNKWIDVPAATFAVGMDDPESDKGPERYFGWDVESPARTVSVLAFKSQARPISNGDYASYLQTTRENKVPTSWSIRGEPTHDQTPGQSHVNGAVNGPVCEGGQLPTVSERFLHGKSIKTAFGHIPLKLALSWPAIASYDELASCARWMGGRIPRIDEVRSIYNFVDLQKRQEAAVSALRIPAVNGHLVNNGVEETPPSHPCSYSYSGAEKSTPDPTQFFVDLTGANVGFKHFHPMPVTHTGDKLCGQGETGGAWEWTSSALEAHEGYVPMDAYPAYSSDFFDGKHNVVLGGSWATHPRLAGRKSFVNWYQRNYPYVWATARVVKDA